MGEHVHEHVELEVDSEQLTAGPEDPPEEQLRSLVEAIAGDSDVEVEIETTTEVR